jgi:hypothetical protein
MNVRKQKTSPEKTMVLPACTGHRSDRTALCSPISNNSEPNAAATSSRRKSLVRSSVINTFKTEGEAIEKANDSGYGLATTTVYTKGNGNYLSLLSLLSSSIFLSIFHGRVDMDHFDIGRTVVATEAGVMINNSVGLNPSGQFLFFIFSFFLYTRK